MTGYLLLAGGAEFGGRMADPDEAAIAAAGGFAAPIRIVPTAAAPDRNHERAGGFGVRWFRHLGATDVAILPLLGPESAHDPALLADLRAARLIYFLGGFPGHVATTIRIPTVRAALASALAADAVLAGSSAGAMALCAWLLDPSRDDVVPGADFVPGACVLPHHDTFGRTWVSRLTPRLPQVTLIGIDERTAIFGRCDSAQWRVLGQGSVTLYHNGVPQQYPTGTSFSRESIAH